MTQLCAQFGVEKVATMPYQAQCNGQVEKAHQTLARIIGKLEPKQKHEWTNHLAELTHAYNLTWSAITGFSPYYPMFGHQPRLPIDYYFPVDQVMGRTKLVDAYVLKLVTTLRSTFKATREVTQESWPTKKDCMTGKHQLLLSK